MFTVRKPSYNVGVVADGPPFIHRMSPKSTSSVRAVCDAPSSIIRRTKKGEVRQGGRTESLEGRKQRQVAAKLAAAETATAAKA